MTERQDIIKITGLQKSFGDLHVLKRIDLNIKEKEVVVIIGPSGSGKSTLLRCINYLEEPTGGEIVFDNIPLDGKAKPGAGSQEGAEHGSEGSGRAGHDVSEESRAGGKGE